MKKTLLFLMALMMSASFAFAANVDLTNPDVLSQGLTQSWNGASWNADTKTITFTTQWGGMGWDFWTKEAIPYTTLTVEFEPVDYDVLLTIQYNDTPATPNDQVKVAGGEGTGKISITIKPTAVGQIVLQNSVANVTLKLKSAMLSNGEGGGGGGGEEPQPATAIYGFDNDGVGTSLQTMHDWGWPTDPPSTAVVAADPLRDGNSLKVTTANWCTAAIFTVNLPEGKTVADITEIQFETYFGDNVTDWEKYKEVELFITKTDDYIGSGAWSNWTAYSFWEYPVLLKGPDCGEDKSNCLQVAADGAWQPITITREQILDEGFNAAMADKTYKPDYKPDFSKVNDLSEFLFGIGINIHGTQEQNENNLPTTPVIYYMDNITFVLNGGSGIIQVKPEIKNVYNIAGGIGVNANNEKVSVYGIDGRLIKQSVAGYNSFIPLLRGIYIVKVGTANPVKVLVK